MGNLLAEYGDLLDGRRFTFFVFLNDRLFLFFRTTGIFPPVLCFDSENIRAKHGTFRKELNMRPATFNPFVKPFLIVSLCVLLPHAVYAGAWTLEKGRFWGKITGLTQSTTARYDTTGTEGAIPAGATYQTRQLFLDLFYGISDRVDIGVQVPYCNNKFADVASAALSGPLSGVTLHASGLGDVRGFAKINLVQESIVATLKLGVKAPTGEFLDHAKEEAVSTGQGQWDIDIIAQLGRSFYPAPAYANIDLGYRLRQKNSTNNYDPPEEFIYNAEFGVTPVDKILLALKLEGIYSSGPRITYFAPTVFVTPVPNVSLEASFRMPFGGRDFFTGRIWGVGLYFQK